MFVTLSIVLHFVGISMGIYCALVSQICIVLFLTMQAFSSNLSLGDILNIDNPYLSLW